MKRFARALVVSTVCLLSFANSASAECAWIVWQQLLGGTPTFTLKAWRPIASLDRKQDCDAAARRGNAAEQKKEQPRACYGCLPDSMDPRMPKAN